MISTTLPSGSIFSVGHRVISATTIFPSNPPILCLAEGRTCGVISFGGIITSCKILSSDGMTMPIPFPFPFSNLPTMVLCALSTLLIILPSIFPLCLPCPVTLTNTLSPCIAPLKFLEFINISSPPSSGVTKPYPLG